MSLYELARQIRSLRDGGLPVEIEDVLAGISRQEELRNAHTSDVVWYIAQHCRRRLNR